MTTRKQRGKRESFFLEFVKDELLSLSQEIADIKLLVIQSFLPPVAPPVIETSAEDKDEVITKPWKHANDDHVPRDMLLSLRPCRDKFYDYNVILPKVLHAKEIDQYRKHQQVSDCVQVDWDSLVFSVDSLHDEQTTTLGEYSEICDFRTDHTTACATGDNATCEFISSSDQECTSLSNIAGRIRHAQRQAWRRASMHGKKLTAVTRNLLSPKHHSEPNGEDSFCKVQDDGLDTYFDELRRSISAPGFSEAFDLALKKPGRMSDEEFEASSKNPLIENNDVGQMIYAKDLYEWGKNQIIKLKTLPHELKGAYFGRQVALLESQYKLSDAERQIIDKIFNEYAPSVAIAPAGPRVSCAGLAKKDPPPLDEVIRINNTERIQDVAEYMCSECCLLYEEKFDFCSGCNCRDLIAYDRSDFDQRSYTSDDY